MEATGNGSDGWYGEKFFDLFTAALDNNGKWSTPAVVPPPVNAASSDGAACWDAKNNVMYFTRCEKIKGKEGFCRIFKSAYNGTAWGTPEALPFAVKIIIPVTRLFQLTELLCISLLICQVLWVEKISSWLNGMQLIITGELRLILVLT
jgi:hypothetical protein